VVFGQPKQTNLELEENRNGLNIDIINISKFVGRKRWISHLKGVERRSFSRAQKLETKSGTVLKKNIKTPK